MGGRCVYCNKVIVDERAMEICDSCGVKVWGQKMFKAILNTTNDAKKNDDLCMTNTSQENFKDLELARKGFK